jgi:hypothetical protein
LRRSLDCSCGAADQFAAARAARLAHLDVEINQPGIDRRRFGDGIAADDIAQLSRQGIVPFLAHFGDVKDGGPAGFGDIFGEALEMHRA